MDLWQQCKRRAAAIADKVPNTTVVDLMIHSRITENDDNYIDGVHYIPAVASELAGILSRVQQGEVSEIPEMRLLSGQPERHRTAKVRQSPVNGPH
jgi:hypothetical protein